MACQDYDGSPFVIIQDLDFDMLVHWIWKVHSGTAILHILVSLLIILLELTSHQYNLTFDQLALLVVTYDDGVSTR